MISVVPFCPNRRVGPRVFVERRGKLRRNSIHEIHYIGCKLVTCFSIYLTLCLEKIIVLESGSASKLDNREPKPVRTGTYSLVQVYRIPDVVHCPYSAYW